MNRYRMLWLIVLSQTLALTHLWVSQSRVILSSPNESRKYVAQVIARREFPYLSISAYLVVNTVEPEDNKLRILLTARDEYLDVVNEARSLTWNGDTLHLGYDPKYYNGKISFQF